MRYARFDSERHATPHPSLPSRLLQVDVVISFDFISIRRVKKSGKCRESCEFPNMLTMLKRQHDGNMLRTCLIACSVPVLINLIK